LSYISNLDRFLLIDCDVNGLSEGHGVGFPYPYPKAGKSVECLTDDKGSNTPRNNRGKRKEEKSRVESVVVDEDMSDAFEDMSDAFEDMSDAFERVCLSSLDSMEHRGES